MTVLSQPSKNGVELIAVIGYQTQFEYVDQEPSAAPLSTDAIRGTITGVPKMGSAMWLGFVGQSLDCTAFSSANAPTDWGDGSGLDSGSFTHTYSTAGRYLASDKDGSGNALAVRQVCVIYAPGSEPSNPDPYQVAYPLILDGEVRGDTNMGFGVQCHIRLNTAGYSDSSLAVLGERSLIGIFGREWKDGTTGSWQYVGGGWATERAATPDLGADVVSFTAYGALYWLLNADMREMFFIDPGIPGADMAQQQLNQGTAFDINNYINGYNASHWLKCQPTITAMHVLQHVRVYIGAPGSPINPTMVCPQGTNSYGTLGQFIDINADSDVDEDAGRTSAGFQGYSCNQGKVLQNVRSLLENEGFRIYECHNLTMKFERLPYYRTVQPATKLQITDVKNLLAKRGAKIQPGGTKYVRQVIVAKAVLAVPSDMTNTAQLSGATTGVQMRDPEFVKQQFIADPLGVHMGTYGNLLQNAIPDGTFGGNNQIKDALQQSLDPTQFFAKYPDPARPFGVTIQCDNVYSLDALSYAQGRDKQERAAAGAILPLGQDLSINLGDIIELTYSNAKLGISWTAKRFEVTTATRQIQPGKVACTVEVIEVDPDE